MQSGRRIVSLQIKEVMLEWGKVMLEWDKVTSVQDKVMSVQDKETIPIQGVDTTIRHKVGRVVPANDET